MKLMKFQRYKNNNNNKHTITDKYQAAYKKKLIKAKETTKKAL